jgi:hypothetical protein
MPSVCCSVGEVLAMTISVNWTMAAMVTMKDSVRRYSSPNGINR